MKVLRAVCLVLGAGWLYAAAAKVVDPEAAYELLALLTGGGGAALVGLGVAIGVEAALGAAILLGLVRGPVPSLVLIGALSLVAWNVRTENGAWVPCGCLGGDGTVEEALARNAWIAAGLVVLIGVEAVARRRAERDP